MAANIWVMGEAERNTGGGTDSTQNQFIFLGKTLAVYSILYNFQQCLAAILIHVYGVQCLGRDRRLQETT